MSETLEHDEHYLLTILQPLCDDTVEVKREVDEMGVHLTIYVAKRDMGHVLGKKAATIGAIRHLMRSFGGKTRAAISVTLDDPYGPPQDRRNQPRTDE